MRFSKTLVCGLAAIAGNTLVAAAPIKGFDTSSSIIPPADLKEEIESSANAADSANIQGELEDSGLFDDLERLLNIIGDHVDRMRGEGNDSPKGKGFKLKDSDKKNGTKPVLAKELEHKGAASPSPAGDDDNINTGFSATEEPATEPAEPGFPPFQGAPGPSIFDPPSPNDHNDFPNSLHHNDGVGHDNTHQQEEESHPAPPPPAGSPEVSEPDHGFTNITCKGISVCNPVTVFHEKGANKKGKGKGWASWGNFGSWGKTTAAAGEEEATDMPAEEQTEQTQQEVEVDQQEQQQ